MSLTLHQPEQNLANPCSVAPLAIPNLRPNLSKDMRGNIFNGILRIHSSYLAPVGLLAASASRQHPCSWGSIPATSCSFVAVLRLGFAKAVVGIEALGKHLNVELENLNRVFDTFHLREPVAEAIELRLAKFIRVLLSRLQSRYLFIAVSFSIQY
jgi:hypothetical protein